MKVDEIVTDIYSELPFFQKTWMKASVLDYVSINHLPILGIALSVFLWVL